MDDSSTQQYECCVERKMLSKKIPSTEALFSVEKDKMIDLSSLSILLSDEAPFLIKYM